jgi:DNA processing protein
MALVRQRLNLERAHWLAWSQVVGVGPILLKRMHQWFGDLSTAWQAEGADLLEVDGIGLSLASDIIQQRQSLNPLEALVEFEGHHSNFWTPADESYPPLLWEIADPPPLLFYRGCTELASAVQTMPSVGIVGTRSPSSYGQRWTCRITQQLVDHDVVIISGLAAGIDRWVHQQTLDSGGLTIAVLGTGVDQTYPWSNRSLQAKVATQGLLLSEHPNGTPPDRTHFPRRNRIIAGLSRAVVVTEAPVRSGALITARLANEYGRDVFALPGSLDNPCSRGCLNLIDQGAQMILDETTLIRALGQLPRLDASGSSTGPLPCRPFPDHLSPAMAQVLAVIPGEPIKLDQIVQQLAMPTGEILSILMQLELAGVVTQLPGMQYQRCP